MARRRRGVPVSVYLTEDVYEKMEEIIEQSGMTMSEAVRNAIDLYHRALFQNRGTEDLVTAIQKAIDILESVIASQVPSTETTPKEGL